MPLPLLTYTYLSVRAAPLSFASSSVAALSPLQHTSPMAGSVSRALALWLVLARLSARRRERVLRETKTVFDPEAKHIVLATQATTNNQTSIQHTWTPASLPPNISPVCIIPTCDRHDTSIAKGGTRPARQNAFTARPSRPRPRRRPFPFLHTPLDSRHDRLRRPFPRLPPLVRAPLHKHLAAAARRFPTTTTAPANPPRVHER